ncbi:MAG: hypothetical protein NC206_10055, partial [Bacteroides sp.]|nr:hypothetical protein [Roseburia sp.]MCM1347410.1 hypothetical protein [Bacteroides sp.]MCM1420597.1 hypothetical protein [Bacteroides sp.]
MNRALPRLQKRDSTEVFEPRKQRGQTEQSDRLKDIEIQPETHLFSPKVPQNPKLQGAENLFPRHTDFLRKVNEIYFQGAQNFQSPLFGPKSGIFPNHVLKKTATAFSMLRKTKMDFEPEKRLF